MGRAVLDPREQSVCRDGVGVDPEVTDPLCVGVAFCSAVGLACSREGAPAPLGSEGFLSRFSGPGLVPRNVVSANATRSAASQS